MFKTTNQISGYISVIGAGSWGTTLACLLAGKGYDVTLWTREPELADTINEHGENRLFLPGISLPGNLHAVSDPALAVEHARYIICAVPTQYIRSVFSLVSGVLPPDCTLVSISKGIEIETLKTPSMILSEILKRPVAVLSGPSFAAEVASKHPTAVTLSTHDQKSALILQELFTTSFFRVYTHDDLIGVEMGGALKNIIAIASGICDGLGLGYNARAALITRGLSEITRLGVSMHAREITFFGLSGLGDLVLTCTSLKSRNYTVGYMLGQGQQLGGIVSRTQSVAEGVPTTKAAHRLAMKNGVEMPITEQVYLALYENKKPHEALNDLMSRSLKAEFS